MKYSLTPDIETRDGSLAKDALTVNVIGGQVRPGIILQTLPAGATVPPVGYGRGLVYNQQLAFAYVVGAVMYFYTSARAAVSFPIDGTQNPVSLLSVLSPIWASPEAYVLLTSPGTTGFYYYTYSTGVVTAVSALSGIYFVSGIVALDDTYYVLTRDGAILGSALGDFTTWNALNSLMVDLSVGDDFPVALRRHLNYIVAFTRNTLQFFYDNGNPAPGSPLSAAATLLTPIGCLTPDSIILAAGGYFFLGSALEGSPAVYYLTGNQVVKVSTPAVERVLIQVQSTHPFTTVNYIPKAGAVYSSLAVFNGKPVYILTFPYANITLYYNFEDKLWGTLTSSVSVGTDANGVPIFTEGYLKLAFAVAPPNDFGPMYQDMTTGRLVKFDTLNNSQVDLGEPIVARVQTQPVFDDNTNSLRRIAATEIIGDKIAGTAYLSYSDDDYATWSTWQPVSLSARRSRVLRQGATHRRSYRLQYSEALPMRFKELQLDVPVRPVE